MRKKPISFKKAAKKTPAVAASALATLAFGCSAYAQQTPSDDPLVQALIQKGILSQAEANNIESEIAARQTNEAAAMPPSNWLVPNTIERMQLFGDVRFRYEDRTAENVDTVPDTDPNTTGIHSRERFRYALRIGVRGDLYDDFNYGLRLETSSNPRSPWDTFGNNTTSGSVTPSDKGTSGIYLGQLYLGWHPADWYEMTVGRMPMPLYTTPMVWDSDINPEGAFEKFKFTTGNVDWFADFGQFVYQNVVEAVDLPSEDTFLLTWQAGANVKLTKDMSFKIAPMLYTYTGKGAPNNYTVGDSPSDGLYGPYVGQGYLGQNAGVPGSSFSSLTLYNQEGINDLLVMEVPAEFNFKIWDSPVGTLHGRVFGDFAYNFQGEKRAQEAYNANPAAFPGLSGPVSRQNIAYQVGVGVGSDGPAYGPTQGLVYGTTSKKNTWETRVYWQSIEQYALDVNLIDSDFFEGRANLQGVYAAFAYSFTDSIIGTIRYGHADRINSSLGTGGNNLDLPGINPVLDYNLLQMDLTWRF